jgi:hypothetical protein
MAWVCACSGPSRSPIPAHADHRFRPCRSPLPGARRGRVDDIGA